MERKRTFTEKIIVTCWNIIVFIGVAMFVLDFPYEICELFNLKETNILSLRIIAIVACIYLYFKTDEIKNKKQ